MEVFSNANLEEKYQQQRLQFHAKGHLKEILAFHGTTKQAMDSIVKDNFLIEKLGVGSGGWVLISARVWAQLETPSRGCPGDYGWYGAGIYFSEYADEASKYGRDSKCLLLSYVLLGREYTCPGEYVVTDRCRIRCPC